MTKGEKMQLDFPEIEMWGESKDTLDYSLGGMIHRVTKSWWNSEYKEPRKGHWILTDVERDRVWHCHCSECGKDPQNYVGGSENWWLIKSKLPKFCPNCGADMRGTKE